MAYVEYGDPNGIPVIFTHGFGESASYRHWDDSVAAEYGLRMIAPNLPGIAGSTRQPGRNLTGWGRDCEELADLLGLGQFLLAGHSAGAIHTLAAAARLGDRVGKVVLVSPPGPVNNSEDISLMRSSQLRLMARLYRCKLGIVVRALLSLAGWSARRDIAATLEIEARMCPADREALLEPPEQRAVNEHAILEGMGESAGGTYDILGAVFGRWGFDLADITQPVHIFLADDDDLVSPSMIQKLAKYLARVEITRWSKLGHFGFLIEEPWRQVLAEIASQKTDGVNPSKV